MSATDRREAAIEAAARAWWDDPGQTLAWEDRAAEDRAEWTRAVAPMVDAVLALGCDCAERLDAEAERELRTTHPRQSGKREALDRAVRLHDAAEFLKSNPAGVNVTTEARMGPPSSEGRPTTGAPLDADEAVPAPAGSPADGSEQP